MYDSLVRRMACGSSTKDLSRKRQTFPRKTHCSCRSVRECFRDDCFARGLPVPQQARHDFTPIKQVRENPARRLSDLPPHSVIALFLREMGPPGRAVLGGTPDGRDLPDGYLWGECNVDTCMLKSIYSEVQ